MLLFGQDFKGVLLTKTDSSAIPFAVIKITETGKHTLTNDKGEFSFDIPSDISEVHFQILFVNCRDSIFYKLKGSKLNKIYANCLPKELNEVVIKGLTAKEVVKKAVESIPVNYNESNYFAPSFYRQYKKINDTIRNLIEAQMVVMFNLSKSKNRIESKEAVAIESLRRSNQHRAEYLISERISDLVIQNPVFHFEYSSINPKFLDYYSFSFDSTSTADTYIINFSCSAFSNENHGLTNFVALGNFEEGRESGKYTIDAKSLAFIKIERKAFRNKEYNYPKYNNFVIPYRNFTAEFVDGHLLVEYENINNKWYLKSLLHAFTNDYFRTVTYQKAYTISEYYEWYANDVSKYVKSVLSESFFSEIDISHFPYIYDNSRWKKALPSYYYLNKAQVYKDIEQEMEIEKQFDLNGKPGK